MFNTLRGGSEGAETLAENGQRVTVEMLKAGGTVIQMGLANQTNRH